MFLICLKIESRRFLMNKFIAFLAAIFAIVLTAVPTPSVAESAKHDTIVISNTVRVQATIVAINKRERKLTLRRPDGHVVVFRAGKEVRNFKQLNKGDIVVVLYQEAAASKLKKISSADMAGESSVVTRAPKGAMPGMSAMRTSTIAAKVLDVDTEQRLLTVEGPRGGIVTIKVPCGMKTFDSLKKGDYISAVYTEAVAISVHKPGKR
jgi:hypothetical protein